MLTSGLRCGGSPTRLFFFKVAKAKEAEEKIDSELKTLQQTLADIEEARPFDQLTVCFTELVFLSSSF